MTARTTPLDVPGRALVFPRAVLRADGGVVAAGGALLLAGARPIGAFLGLDASPALRAGGVVFVAYGGWLTLAATRASDERIRGLVRAIGLANATWTLCSAAALASGRPPLSAAARRTVAAQAAGVALFAAADGLALYRMR